MSTAPPHHLEVRAASHSYEVMLLTDANASLEASLPACCTAHTFVLTDTTVAQLYGDRLVAVLQQAGRTVHLHSVAPGESAKSLATAAQVFGVMAQKQLGRDATVVACGGGVVGDLGGFVASTYMRGIRLVQLPTTTLAALDSSVGGKTALNLPAAKNLIGTFYPPHAVVCVLPWLSSQKRADHAAGLVEAVKVVATHDAALLTQLRDHAAALRRFAPAALTAILSRAIGLKAAIVERDEREAGERALLNFGHTVGHALERGSHYTLSHGSAVGLGILIESAWAAQQHGAAADVSGALQQTLAALKVPLPGADARLDPQALRLDKKRRGTAVSLPVVTRLGHATLHQTSTEALLAFAKSWLQMRASTKA